MLKYPLTHLATSKAYNGSSTPNGSSTHLPLDIRWTFLV